MLKFFRFYSLSLLGLILLLTGCATQTQKRIYSYSSQAIARNTYRIPPAGNDIIGKNYYTTVEKGDTIDTIAAHNDVGALELKDANPGIRPYHLRIGSRILIPAQYILPPEKYRSGIVINVAELRLYYFNKTNHTVMTFPVALGRQGWRTPITNTYVFRKVESPSWHVPKSIREHALKKGEKMPNVIPPGPDNPLGDYAIYLHLDGYLIHGTNNDASIGRLVSSGCIRMYNRDVAMLYPKVRRGTPVHIIYYPNKAGWRDDHLYLESHSPVNYEDQEFYRKAALTVTATIMQTDANRPAKINWSKVTKLANEHTGVPEMVGYALTQGSII